MDLTTLTIREAHEGLKNGDFTSVDMTKAYLKKIKDFDGELNAFLSVTEKLALEQAIRVDERIALSGVEGHDFSMLCGIPCAIKDAIMVEGEKCTAGSKILENYVAPYDATVIKKLKEQGAIILGKTNTDEFTMGSSTENSAFGVTKNPHDKTRVAGGSSGGSAAAVAANMACYTLGSDTGGSIRQPASLCGVVGLCPTYGAVSRYGLIAHASSLDQIGPFAKNIEDAKIVFDSIKGKDSMDATSAELNLESLNAKPYNLKAMRIGVPKEYFSEGVEPEVEKIIKSVIKKAEDKNIIQIAKEISELAEKARTRKIDLMDLKGGTFTITNYGSVGGTYGTPILNLGEAGILGLGRIFGRVVSVNGRFKVVKILPVSLTFDHRILDGAQAARFLESLRLFLEDPDHLLLELK